MWHFVLAVQCIATMSLLIENEVGWLVDHEQEINSTYTMTCMFENYRLSDYLTKRTDYGRQSDCSVFQFKSVPELFAIYHSFMMDSQFCKHAKMSQLSDNSDVMKKLNMHHSETAHESTNDCPMSSASRPLQTKVHMWYDITQFFIWFIILSYILIIVYFVELFLLVLNHFD